MFMFRSSGIFTVSLLALAALAAALLSFLLYIFLFLPQVGAVVTFRAHQAL
jgi:hypothetical protein